MSKKLLMFEDNKLPIFTYDKEFIADKEEGVIDYIPSSGEFDLNPAKKYAYLIEMKANTEFTDISAKYLSKNILTPAAYNEQTGKYDYTVVTKSADGIQSANTVISLDYILDKYGDNEDRLYWDANEGEYLIEKKVAHDVFVDSTGWNNTPYQYVISYTLAADLTSDANTYPNCKSNAFLEKNANISTGSQNTKFIANYSNLLAYSTNVVGTSDKTLLDAQFNPPLHVVYPISTIIIRTGIKRKIRIPIFGDGTTFILKRSQLIYSGDVEVGAGDTYGTVKIEVECVETPKYVTINSAKPTLTVSEGQTIPQGLPVYLECFIGNYDATSSKSTVDSTNDAPVYDLITFGERTETGLYRHVITVTSPDGSIVTHVPFDLEQQVVKGVNISTADNPGFFWSDELGCYKYHQVSKYFYIDSVDDNPYGSFTKQTGDHRGTGWRSPVIDNVLFQSSYSYNGDLEIVSNWDKRARGNSFTPTYAPYALMADNEGSGGSRDEKHRFWLFGCIKGGSSYASSVSAINEVLSHRPLEFIADYKPRGTFIDEPSSIKQKIQLPCYGPGTIYQLKRTLPSGKSLSAKMKLSFPTISEHVIEYKNFKGYNLEFIDDQLTTYRYDQPMYIEKISGETFIDIMVSSQYGYEVHAIPLDKSKKTKRKSIKLTKYVSTSTECSEFYWDDEYRCYAMTTPSGVIYTTIYEKIQIPLFKGGTKIECYATASANALEITLSTPFVKDYIDIPAPDYTLKNKVFSNSSSTVVTTSIKLFDTLKDFTVLLDFDHNAGTTIAANDGDCVFHCRYESGSRYGLAIRWWSSMTVWMIDGPTTDNSGNILWNPEYIHYDKTTGSTRSRTLIRYKGGYPDRIVNLKVNPDTGKPDYRLYTDYTTYAQAKGSWSAISTHTRPVYIGCYANTSGSKSKYFSGTIYDCRIWNGYALTDNEILHLYEEYIPEPTYEVSNIIFKSSSSTVTDAPVSGSTYRKVNTKLQLYDQRRNYVIALDFTGTPSSSYSSYEQMEYAYARLFDGADGDSSASGYLSVRNERECMDFFLYQSRWNYPIKADGYTNSSYDNFYGVVHNTNYRVAMVICVEDGLVARAIEYRNGVVYELPITRGAASTTYTWVPSTNTATLGGGNDSGTNRSVDGTLHVCKIWKDETMDITRMKKIAELYLWK